MRDESEKEFICRPCGKFLEKDEFIDGCCPECGEDDGIYRNDLVEP